MCKHDLNVIACCELTDLFIKASRNLKFHAFCICAKYKTFIKFFVTSRVKHFLYKDVTQIVLLFAKCPAFYT